MNTLLPGSCPGCGSSNVRRSQRRGIERFAPWFGLLTFRCNRCLSIFFKPVPESDAPPSTHGLQGMG